VDEQKEKGMAYADICITSLPMRVVHMANRNRQCETRQGKTIKDKTVELTLLRLFGFLTGATTAGAGMYYYVIDEYRVSNQLLTEDIYV
jgi:hypothetical protein